MRQGSHAVYRETWQIGCLKRVPACPVQLDPEIWACKAYAGFLLKDLIISYHNKETILFTIDPYYGSLN